MGCTMGATEVQTALPWQFSTVGHASPSEALTLADRHMSSPPQGNKNTDNQ